MAESSKRLTRYPWWRRWFGRRSERAAAAYLRGLGWAIVAWNEENAGGELDLVAVDDRTIVIVEVRSTEGDDTERTAASVDLSKQQRLTRAALAWLQAKRLLDAPIRFDVLILSWPTGQANPRITHHRHAFEAVGRYQQQA
ncbi:YraN family protein [Tuwongella immobilis]|uniref:UPF0102 protein GMBLW1_42100 n=1 Tax=Tuwongella immobilis TaxID=692036 RepID=A0A6C2YUZ3_9BACT|nr:YraN family protein [Tuwongella immobilis]VIP04983.1 endonuclease : UPF0102 protein PM8797T_28449 OS=Planctomyces maris DSM 8797 GN=PM8797T_28449 PE=3 SV=1: UPF0102 [Tuwongella immobilis]VTS07324.1 endonuclease : UPF0102 protein PM8797T_28449 OS=Planctomyces maris DSM 8797 GN=PM8797T_28449 PE=3 SV=1: UPF0102 [Tuwongella immobilis]